MQPSSPQPHPVTLRTDLRPGDVDAIISMHGSVYAREHGFDADFAAYVAGPLGTFASSPGAGERLWIAESQGRLVGCIAIVAPEPQTAQLRWFLVDPASRGAGLGKRLLREAVSFARDAGYHSIILWTVSTLASAAHLYREVGFRKIQEQGHRRWGVEVVEEQYELRLT
jgi:GNAT superfamily N-acetyltransferase